MRNAGLVLFFLAMFALAGCVSERNATQRPGSDTAYSSDGKTILIADYETADEVDGWKQAGTTFAQYTDYAAHGNYSGQLQIQPHSVSGVQYPQLYRNGFWDLSDYTNLILHVRNNSRFYTKLMFGLSDSGGGAMSNVHIFPPGETVKVDIDLAKIAWRVDLSCINKIGFTGYEIPDTVNLNIDYIHAKSVFGRTSPRQKVLRKVLELKSQFDSLDATRYGSGPAYGQISTELNSMISALSADQISTGTSLKQISIDLESLRDDFGLLAHKFDSGIFVWQMNPWEDITPRQMPDKMTQETTSVDVSVAGNEYEDVVLVLSNFDDDTKTLQLAISGAGAELINSIKFADFMTQRDGTLAGDILRPLSEENGMYELVIPAEMSRQIWIRVDTKKEQARFSSGQAPATLQIIADKRPVKSIVLRINKWDFTLPDESADVVTWHYFMPDIASYPYREAVVANMADYGFHVQTIHPSQMPWPILDKDKRIIGLDTKYFEEPIKIISKDPDAKYLFLLSLSGKRFRGLNNELEYMSDEWKRVFKEWTSVHIVNYMTARGIEKSRYEFRSTDEPDKTLLYEDVEIAKLLKEADPELRFGINTSMVTVDFDTAVAPWVDTLQPDLMYVLEYNPRVLDVMKAGGKKIWCYSCLGGLRNHDALFYDYYRLQAWKMNKYGLKGIGVWVYFRDGSPVHDLIYVDGGILMSRCIEAYREGLEDNKYLTVLRSRISALKAVCDDAMLIRNAQQLIADAIEDVTDNYNDPARVYVWRKLIAKKIIELQKHLYRNQK